MVSTFIGLSAVIHLESYHPVWDGHGPERSMNIYELQWPNGVFLSKKHEGDPTYHRITPGFPTAIFAATWMIILGLDESETSSPGMLVWFHPMS